MRLLFVALLLLAGCVDPTAVRQEPSDFHWQLGESMSPDFTGDGPSYPVLLLHQHNTMSRAEAKEWEGVVCFADGTPIPPVPPVDGRNDIDAAACMGPPFNAATGRVHAAPRQDWGGPAVALVSGCNGGILVFPEDGVIHYDAPGHTFRIHVAANGFLVDGHAVRPGQTLKVDYWIAKGDPDHEKPVKVVFDHPGRWLYSMIGDEGPRPLPPPEKGAGRIAYVDASAADLESILGPLLDATPGNQGIADWQIVWADRLTEVRATVRVPDGSVQWYNAAREGDRLRMLAEETFDTPAVVPFDAATLGDLRQLPGAGDAVTSWRLVPGHAVASLLPGVPAHMAPHDCLGCLYQWSDGLGQGWRWMVAGSMESSPTASIGVEGDDLDGTHRSAFLTR